MSAAHDAEELYLAPDIVPGHVPEWERIADNSRFRERLLFLLPVLVIPPAGTVAAFLSIPYLHPGWVELTLFAVFYVITFAGVEVGFHRLFSHRAFDAPPWVRGLFAFAGGMAAQGTVLYWVTHHRAHHARSDREGDPHSPWVHGGGFRGRIRGIYYAHIGWLGDLSRERPCAGRYGRDIVRDKIVMWVDSKYYYTLVISFTLPAFIGFLVYGNWIGALNGFLWGGAVRVFAVQHLTYAVNSICHIAGSRPFKSKDESRNIWALAPLTFGGSLHNTHHAFPASARNSTAWYEFDPGWRLIRSLEMAGIVKEARVPTAKQIEQRRRRHKTEA